MRLIQHANGYGDNPLRASGFRNFVLITGGSGRLASHILNAFLVRGYCVRITVRSITEGDDLLENHRLYSDKLSFVVVKDIDVLGS